MARAMKDSGIVWIGEIPEGWKVSKVSTFFDIQLGKMLQPSQENESDTYESYLCAANLGNNKLKMEPLKQMWFSREDKEKFSVRCGDLLVVEGGDVASSDIIAEPVHGLYIQNALHRVRSRNGFELRFLRYYLSIAKASGHIDLICNKATIAHFTKDKFGALPYVVVPLEEQKRIADYLDSECARIDAVIEQTRTSIEEYKKLKQSVITQAVTKGIRPGRKMKDSGVEWIGEIPESFTRRKLKTFSEIISKGTTPKEMETEFNDIYTVRYIKSENIVANRLQELPLFTITEQIHFGELQRSKLSDRDILFVIAGASIGKVAIMRKDMLPANTNQATCFIRINTQYLKYQKYIWYVLQADFIKTYIQLFAVQSAQPNLSMADLGDLFIPVPSEEDEVYHITEYLDSMCARIDYLTNQKEQLLLDLESYKKSLIFEYVTGKKEVQVCGKAKINPF